MATLDTSSAVPNQYNLSGDSADHRRHIPYFHVAAIGWFWWWSRFVGIWWSFDFLSMIPTKVRFTGLEFDPVNLEDRWHRTPVPLDWSRHRFIIPANIQNPVGLLNRWLFTNIEGKWSIWLRYVRDNIREANLAFENDHDGVTFILADARTEAFKGAEKHV